MSQAEVLAIKSADIMEGNQEVRAAKDINIAVIR